jgi:hypothetical protein
MGANHDEIKHSLTFALEEEKVHKEDEREDMLTDILDHCVQNLRKLATDTLHVKTEAGREALINEISNTIDKIRVIDAKLKNK